MGAQVSNVVAFDARVIPPGEADPYLVEILEKMLARAKSGDLRALGYACCYLDGSHGVGWAGADGTRHPLASGIMMLHGNYARSLVE